MTGPVDFRRLYEDDADPWRLATTAYELEKYRSTVEAIEPLKPQSLFEPACSIGVLTHMLTAVCSHVVASDISEVAVRQARTRAPRATVDVGSMPDDWPDASFDVIVASEFLYYLPSIQRQAFYRRSRAHLTPTGAIVAIHWRHRFDEGFLTGDEIHGEIAEATGCSPRTYVATDEFRVDIFQGGTMLAPTPQNRA